MTSFVSPIQAFEMPQFVFLSNQPKKSNNNNNKSRGQPARPTQNRPVYQGARFNGAKQVAKKQGYSQYESQYKSYNYVKNNGFKSGSDDYYRANLASTASDSDGTNNSDLTGFKIQCRGKTIHDETEEDFELNDMGMNWPLKENKEKFASSVMFNGPASKDIPLPSFV